MNKKELAIELLTQLKKDTIYDVLHGDGRDFYTEQLNNIPCNSAIDEFCNEHNMEDSEFLDLLDIETIHYDLLENMNSSTIILDVVHINLVETHMGYDTRDMLNRLTHKTMIDVFHLLRMGKLGNSAYISVNKNLVSYVIKKELEELLQN